MKRILCCGLLLLSLVTSAGCAQLFDPGPPMATVLLPAKLPEPAAVRKVPVSLLVTRPAADSATDTDRIMALMDGYEVRALDSAKWVASIPVLLQRQIVDAMEASRALEAIGWEDSSLAVRYRLSSDLRRFFLRYDAGSAVPVADIAIVFSLVEVESGKIVARKYVHSEEVCEGNSVEYFVAAFSRAVSRMLAETVAWTLETLQEHVAATPPGKR